MTNKGVIYAATAYAIWGFFPLYFKMLHPVDSFQITAHRMSWSVLFVLIFIAARRELPALKAALTRRNVLIYLVAAVLLTINWGTYVWAVNAGYVVETSLGYFINPLVNVLLGVIFLRERLRPLQWLPVALAAAGVAYLTITYGHLPWIALTLAFSFGLYGFAKKTAPLPPVPGLGLETIILFFPAFAFLVSQEIMGVGAFGHTNLWLTILMILTGVVTPVPLLLFASGARTVPLSTMGLLQFITPTFQFLAGVLVFGEPFTHDRVIGFSIIWLALIIFTVENFLSRGRLMGTPTAPTR